MTFFDLIYLRNEILKCDIHTNMSTKGTTRSFSNSYITMLMRFLLATYLFDEHHAKPL